MSRLSFYSEIHKIMDEARSSLVKERAELAELEKDVKSGKYTAQHIRETLRPQIDEKKMRIEIIQENAKAAAEKALAVYAEECRAADVLNPADLHDGDIRLLNCGVELTQRDLSDMLRRNDGNSTMEQLILRYAKTRGINLGKQYVGAESELHSLEPYVLNGIMTVSKFPENEAVYSQIFGEESGFYEAYGK